VGVVDFEPGSENARPEHRDLLALCDRIRGDKGGSAFPLRHVMGGTPVPSGDVVEGPSSWDSLKDAIHVGDLCRVAPLLRDKGRIAKQVGATIGREYVIPVLLQGVLDLDRRGIGQRQVNDVKAEGL
jgi:hypothetical protein